MFVTYKPTWPGCTDDIYILYKVNSLQLTAHQFQNNQFPRVQGCQTAPHPHFLPPILALLLPTFPFALTFIHFAPFFDVF